MESSGQTDISAKKSWTPVRRSLAGVACALVAMFFSSCNSMNDASKANANAPKITVAVKQPNNGATAPSAEPAELPANALDASLKTIDGKAFKLSELKGKVLVIDLWATWCGPCRYEVPELVKLQQEYGPRGFEVIGLDIDPGSDKREDVEKFIKEFEINYKVAFADEDLARSLMHGGNIPQSMVVGKDGRVIEHLVGFHPVNTPKRMRAAIEQALQ